MVFLHLSKIVFKKECKNVERVGMIPHIISNQNAKVAELVDALVLGTSIVCFLYTSDAAEEEDSLDLGCRRFLKKKKISHRHE